MRSWSLANASCKAVLWYEAYSLHRKQSQSINDHELLIFSQDKRDSLLIVLTHPVQPLVRSTVRSAPSGSWKC